MYKMHKRLLTGLGIALIVVAAAAQDTDTNAPALAGSTTNLVAPSPVVSRAGSFGLGPLLGEPMGVGGKLWLSDKTAVDAGAGWSLLDPEGFQFHGDFLFHKFNLFRAEQRDLPLYFGVGGRVKFVEHGDNRAGIRVPVGISYLLDRHSLELFAEVVPILDLAPKTTLEWNGGVGLRYYFH